MEIPEEIIDFAINHSSLFKRVTKITRDVNVLLDIAKRPEEIGVEMLGYDSVHASLGGITLGPGECIMKLEGCNLYGVTNKETLSGQCCVCVHEGVLGVFIRKYSNIADAMDCTIALKLLVPCVDNSHMNDVIKKINQYVNDGDGFWGQYRSDEARQALTLDAVALAERWSQ